MSTGRVYHDRFRLWKHWVGQDSHHQRDRERPGRSPTSGELAVRAAAIRRGGRIRQGIHGFPHVRGFVSGLWEVVVLLLTRTTRPQRFTHVRGFVLGLLWVTVLLDRAVSSQRVGRVSIQQP